MDRPTVYVETTIVSYLAARPSRDIITAGHQQITHEWWAKARPRFRLVTSPLVRREAGAGDPAYAAKRLDLLREVELLTPTPQGMALARRFVESGALPRKAQADAIHIAVAAIHGIEFFLTWNCKHIANAEIQPALIRGCLGEGFRLPILCTPEQLLGVFGHDPNLVD